FSSRRRHTRSKRDWSSDVCSSDLKELERIERRLVDLSPPKSGWYTCLRITGNKSTRRLSIRSSSLSKCGAASRSRLRHSRSKGEIGRASGREGVQRWEWYVAVT